MTSTQNEIRTSRQSYTGAILTWQDGNGPILIQDPPYDGRGVIDLTCELEADTDTICEEAWVKTEKAAEEKERENQWLRAENSRLGRELQNAKYANNGSTEGLDDEDFMGACSLATTNASVTTVNTSGIAHLAATPTLSAMTSYSTSANLTIVVRQWVGKGCTGYMVESKISTPMLGWYIFNGNRKPYSSFKISRPLRGREQLDFSREELAFRNHNFSLSEIKTDWCGNFLRSYRPSTSPGREY
ncbi:hypothetical protein V491_01502 [Pseudogymnoascus sp. VKM F-3775]|nr:hypothetical protein V491_01502 [Pseudogymnoascus sp. VKM F-3775]